MIIRTFAVWIVMLACTVGLVGGRLFYLMVVKGDFYRQKAAEQQLYDTEITASRGNIYDPLKDVNL